MRTARSVLASIVLLAVFLLPDTAAQAITYHACQDRDWPVSINVIRVTAETVAVYASAPVDGIVHFYASDNGANPHAAYFAQNIQAGHTVGHLAVAGLPHHYWIAHTTFYHSYWYRAGAIEPVEILGSCHSAVVFSW